MIVEASVQQDIPTIWINSKTDEAPCILSEDLDYDRPLSALGDLIMHELAPPFVLDSDEDSSTQKIGADIFFQEVQQRHNFGIFYRLLESTMLKKWPRGLSFKREDYSARSESEWRPLANRMKAADVTSGDQDDEILFPRYCWADNLALHYADIYRSSYALNYLFSALAVFLALFGLIVGNKQIWIALEVMVILHILILTLRGKKNRWHERWIDYRQLAEQLRHLRYLHFAGGLSRESRLNPPADGGLQERSWVQWYYRSTVRELGMASAKCTDKFRSELTTAFVREELEPQVSYHEAKSVSLHKMEHAVHKIGEWVFGATLAICIMFLLLYVASKFDSTHKIADFLYSMNYIVTTATAFLPALGAAMFGIRVQGEFVSTAQRSQAMSRRLFITHEQLSPHLEAAPPSMFELRSHIEMAAETMMIEITDWKFVYSSKPLSLPA
jgi:hypothetical protein